MWSIEISSKNQNARSSYHSLSSEGAKSHGISNKKNETRQKEVSEQSWYWLQNATQFSISIKYTKIRVKLGGWEVKKYHVKTKTSLPKHPIQRSLRSSQTGQVWIRAPAIWNTRQCQIQVSQQSITICETRDPKHQHSFNWTTSITSNST